MPLTTIRSLALAASLASTAAAAPPATHQVQFRSGPAALAGVADEAQRAAAFAAALADPSVRHVLIKFAAPVSNEDRLALRAAGVTLHNYLPEFAFFASVDRGMFKPGAAAAVASIVAVDRIRPEWKLHPFIAEGAIPAYALAKVAKGQAGPIPGEAGPVAAVNIQFHADAPMGLAAAQVVRAYGGMVAGELMSLPVVVAHVPVAGLAGLAAEDAVMWIEPVMPPMDDLSAAALAAGAAAMNNSNRPRVQADILQAAPYNLDGTGVNVFVFDGGSARGTHQTFTRNDGQPGSRVTNLDGSTVASHATHVSGTIGGNGNGSAGNSQKGMAPNVNILSGALNISGCTGGSTGPWFLYNCLTDLESDYSSAVNHPTVPADISNNSIGTNTESNGYPCSLQGDYGITDALIDAIVGGSLGRTLRVVWANGNERQGSRCDTEGFGDYFSTAPPATAKNHVTVGALNSNDDSMTTFSSWGPTDDGRLKPDISAPGCEVGNDNGVTSSTSTSDTSYGASCGTSMASPTVCGVGALIIQDFRAQFPLSSDFRNSTLKVLLAHTAQDLGNPGPDYMFGYGSVRGQAAVDFLRTGAFAENRVGQGETFSRTITVAGGQPLKVTLAWDDPPGTPNASGASALVNDLDLRLIAPDATVHLPWTLNPAAPSNNAVRTAANRRDNIEQVVVDSPMAGQWTVEVVGFNVPAGPQTFSIAGLAPGSWASLAIAPVGTFPAQLPPGQAATLEVTINVAFQSLVAGSETVWSRLDSGPFVSAPLVHVSGQTYRALIAAPRCGHRLEYYFSAAGSETGTTTLPPSAALSPFTLTPSGGPLVTRFTDNFQTDQGWTVTNTPIGGGTFAGAWERGVPVASTGGPSADGDGSGMCFVTGLAANVDVDFGFTTLTSPVIDASGAGAVVSYRRWFHRTSTTANGDVFRTEASLDGGATWSTLELLGASTGTITGSWQQASFPIANPTAQFRVRFTVNDNATNSTAVEGAVDAVVVQAQSCTNACPADWNRDGQVSPADVAAFVNAWFADLGAGTHFCDLDDDFVSTPADIAAFVSLWAQAIATGSC